MRNAFSFGLLAAALLVSAGSAIAAGRWNMPSSPLQTIGFGHGPGYHAPMVLERMYRNDIATRAVIRVHSPPQAPCVNHGCGFSIRPSTLPGPSTYGSQVFQSPQLGTLPAAAPMNPPAYLPPPSRSPSEYPVPAPVMLPDDSNAKRQPQARGTAVPYWGTR